MAAARQSGKISGNIFKHPITLDFIENELTIFCEAEDKSQAKLLLPILLKLIETKAIYCVYVNTDDDNLDSHHTGPRGSRPVEKNRREQLDILRFVVKLISQCPVLFEPTVYYLLSDCIYQSFLANNTKIEENIVVLRDDTVVKHLSGLFGVCRNATVEEATAMLHTQLLEQAFHHNDFLLLQHVIQVTSGQISPEYLFRISLVKQGRTSSDLFVESLVNALLRRMEPKTEEDKRILAKCIRDIGGEIEDVAVMAPVLAERVPACPAERKRVSVELTPATVDFLARLGATTPEGMARLIERAVSLYEPPGQRPAMTMYGRF